jgi:hypothetical protein
VKNLIGWEQFTGIQVGMQQALNLHRFSNVCSGRLYPAANNKSTFRILAKLLPTARHF